MVLKDSITDAYAVLGLEEGATVELVRSTYKQVALRTHPDKNPGDLNATAEFQRVGTAYRTLLNHLENDSEDGSDDEDGYYCYDDDLREAYEEAYFRWLYEQTMKGAFRSGRNTRFHHFHPAPRQGQTKEEYEENLRKSREEQIAAHERREREAIARKEKAAKERERERAAAEARQRVKVERKKTQAEFQRKKTEQTIRNGQQQAQELRSAVFAAARSGNAEKVKKGVWEDTVDAAGGEIRAGCQEFVVNPPEDSQEALMHIAAHNGDLDLVRWLDTNSGDVEERNAQEHTAFHVALKNGQISIVAYFLETYPPKDSDGVYNLSNTNLLSLALHSGEPELVWMILDKKMASSEDINNAWSFITSTAGSASFNLSHGARGSDKETYDDVLKLLMRFGNFTPPPTPQVGKANPDAWKSTNNKGVHKTNSGAHVSLEQISSQSDQISLTEESHKANNYRGRGRSRGRGRGRGRSRGRGSFVAPASN